MTLRALEIRDFRNIAHARLETTADINLIVGPNAAGKTSLLEAIYYLGRVRSFRSGNPRELIRSGCVCFELVGSVEREGGGAHPVGVRRAGRELTVRIGGQPAEGLAELARAVPVLLLNSDTHQLVDAGPQHRRRFLDWGVFQMEPGFLPLWRRYRRALSNRNAALRQGQADRLIDAWTPELADTAQRIDGLRGRFLSALVEALAPVTRQVLPEYEIALDYRRGWAESEGLDTVLEGGLIQDRQAGYTRTGPHTADLRIRSNGARAAGRISRGQQKALVAALMFAQVGLYRLHRGRNCLLLVDDLPAELDAQRRRRLLAALATLPVQTFLTAIEPEGLDLSAWSTPGVFEIEAGEVRKVVY